MEGTSPNTISSSLAGLVGFDFVYGFLHQCQWVLRFQDLYYLFLSFCQIKVACSSVEESEKRENAARTEEKCLNLCGRSSNNNDDGARAHGDVKVRSRDVEVVMEKMGMSCDGKGDKLMIIKEECLGSEELSALFAEEEPSLEEVKEAFDVFDEDRDGFIDARDLQRLLCNLGFGEASSFHACQRMIRAFDTDGDDRIDFNEFAIFMEKSFC